MSTDSKTVLRVKHDYNYVRVRDLHIRMQRDLGKINERWGFQVQEASDDSGSSQYNMEYWFLDARDATLFALKYSGEGFSIDQ